MHDPYVWFYLAGLIATAIGSLVFLKRKRKSSDYAKWDMRIGGLVLLFLISPACMCVGNYIYTSVRIPNDQKQIHADARKIVDALKQFKQRTGHYPEELAELVPQYLEAIPSHPQGWIYRHNSQDDEFLLQFAVPLSGFFGETALWQCSSEHRMPECWYVGD